MKFKKPLIKLITIGSLFFMFSLSFNGIVSLSDNKTNNFWAIKKINLSLIDSTYAEDGEGDEGGGEGASRERGGERNEGASRERGGERNEGASRERGGERNESGNDDNRRNTTPTRPNNPITKLSKPNQICKTVYDTVTTASGATVQEPREVCTTKKTPIKRTPVKREPIKRTPVKREPIKRTLVKKTLVKKIPVQTSNTGLSIAEKAEIKSQFDIIYIKITTIFNTDTEINAILDKISNIITSNINAIQNKINSSNNIDTKNKYNKQLLILQELDSLVFDKTIGSNNIINNILSAGIGFTPIKHIAPIGSTYTIIQSSNGMYTFKRENGTYTNKTWNTPNAVIAYIDKNAVSITNKPRKIYKPRPISVSKPKPRKIYKPRPVVKPKPVVISKPRPAPKPKPKPAPKPAPVINTTTTAS